MQNEVLSDIAPRPGQTKGKGTQRKQNHLPDLER